MLTLAHMSDPHLAPLPKPRLRQLCNKRLIGLLSWQPTRKHQHQRHVLDALCDDLKAQKPDHVALTGDLVNISLPDEFTHAQAWLNTLGSGDWISVIPGNHDAYVPKTLPLGLDLWRDYMTSDEDAQQFLPSDEADFPYIRLRKKIALIGTSTAVPYPPWIARGKLGRDQIERLADVLQKLGEAKYFRVLMIHHPPLVGQNHWRKALADAKALQDVLSKAGVELVLHGHNHTAMHTSLDTTTGKAAVIGVPSASKGTNNHKPAARYNLYRITQKGKAWKCHMTERAYNPGTKTFRKIREIELI